MKLPRVEIFYGQDRGHFSQIYTGFHRLHRQGVIALTQAPLQRCALAARVRKISPPLLVSIEGRLVSYDIGDGRALCETCLEGVERYFKRGYDPRLVSHLGNGQRGKVRPLGLNYRVWDDGFDRFALMRAMRRDGVRGLPGALRSLGVELRFLPRISTLEQAPMFAAEPRALFLTRLWDAEKHPQFTAINDTRIACVAALRAALGSAFVGGIAPDEVSATRCDPALLADRRVVAKGNYLAVMKSTPICVTSAGLFESNGGKLGEYVACSRAIVCEPLVHEVPGDFVAGENYLEFTSPEECVRSVMTLMDDEHRRQQMMLRNFRYYQTFLKPEWLVFNTIVETLAATSAPVSGRLRADAGSAT